MYVHKQVRVSVEALIQCSKFRKQKGPQVPASYIRHTKDCQRTYLTLMQGGRQIKWLQNTSIVPKASNGTHIFLMQNAPLILEEISQTQMPAI